MEQLSNMSTIKNLLSRYGFTFSKTLGQNFLINPNVCPNMAEQCGIAENTGVIEIGPGVGVLTCELAKRAQKVVAIELDKRLLPILAETLIDFNNVKIINNDVMKTNLKELIVTEFPNMNVVVCANLPYYLTSPILMKLLEARLKINAITVMVQKEVAQRICAGVGNRNASSISLAINYYANPQILFAVKKGSFFPAPKVDSAVVNLAIKNSPACEVMDEKLFFKIIRSGFSQRRKNILNSIGNTLGIQKKIFLEILNDLRISPTCRAENLNLENFADIANKLIDCLK